MFGTNPQKELESSILPREIFEKLETEEELERCIMKTYGEDSEKEDNDGNLNESQNDEQKDEQNDEQHNDFQNDDLQCSKTECPVCLVDCDGAHKCKVCKKHLCDRQQTVVNTRKRAYENLGVQAERMLRNTKNKFQS